MQVSSLCATCAAQQPQPFASNARPYRCACGGEDAFKGAAQHAGALGAALGTSDSEKSDPLRSKEVADFFGKAGRRLVGEAHNGK